MRTFETVPADDGFHMPAEWEQHSGTYIIWPDRPDTWRAGGTYAQKAYAAVASAIGRFEPVTVLANRDQYTTARKKLPDYVRVVEMSSDDAWCRDTGPTFVKNKAGEVRGVDWTFNAWGGTVDGLYASWKNDNLIAGKICELERCDRYCTPGFVLEGGSIHVDGEGTALVTAECLLSRGRNPHLPKAQIGKLLASYLNVRKILWLPYGIVGDETNGHVDNICAFVAPGRVVLAWTPDENSPQYARSVADELYLKNQTDAKGRRIEIVRLPLPEKPLRMTEEESAGIQQQPGTKVRAAGSGMAASYVNYYVCNGAVIVPAFGSENDRTAKDIITSLYPGREIIQLPTREILLGGGNIHCITQQVPGCVI
jgi:agmatine deiminase